MDRKLDRVQILSLGAVVMLSLFAGLIILFPSFRESIFFFAGKYLFHRELSNIPYCTSLLIGLVSFLDSAFFFILFSKKTKELFLQNYPAFFSLCALLFFIHSNILIATNKIFIGYSNRWDFGDFVFAIEYYASSSLHNTNYPPLAVLFFKFLHLFFPADGIDKKYVVNYLLTLYTLATAAAIFVLCSFFINGTYRKKTISALALFLTGPILFAYQRMNLILLALIGTLVFVFFYSSKNKYLKEFALISLAIAANIKLFPAIFGALLLKERKWKEAARTMLYGAMLFVIPLVVSNINEKMQKNAVQHEQVEAAVFYKPYNSSVEYITPAFFDCNKNTTIQVAEKTESQSSINDFIKSVNVFTTTKGLWRLSIKAQIYNALSRFSIGDSAINILAIICVLLFLLLSMIGFFLAKQKYQSLLILSLVCILVPVTSVWYFLIFLIIPLLFFFNKTSRTKIDLIISVLFIFIFSYYTGHFKMLYVHTCWHIDILWLITIVDIFYSKFFSHKEQKAL